MGQMQVACENDTEHLVLGELADKVVAVLARAASDMSETAGLTACKVTIRITDQFVAEVEAYDALRYRRYTTERVGGLVAAIMLSRDVGQVEPLILVNSTAFTADPSLGLAYFAMTLGHEVAHCLIGQARGQYGAPQGYCPRPLNLTETVGYTALSVCDEFLADELAKLLVPSIKVTVTEDARNTRVVDRTSLAMDRLTRMCGDLNVNVFPAWRDAVQQYRIKRQSLDDMHTYLVTAIQEGLTLSAHYRSATAELGDDLAEVGQVMQHPGMRLYFIPFWNRVGPLLDARLKDPPFHRFAERDQEVFDVATDAVKGIWLALGITLELLPTGQVYVHVDVPFA